MPRRILVVDDDPAMRALVARHVRRRAPDATVLEAASAEEALLLLEGSGGDGLTVVADLHLGAGMDGGRLLAVVHERHPHARRVLLTGAPGAQADADAIVEKGVRFPGLLDAL